MDENTGCVALMKNKTNKNLKIQMLKWFKYTLLLFDTVQREAIWIKEWLHDPQMELPSWGQ